MKKSELKTNMVVEFRDKAVGVVNLKAERILLKSQYVDIDNIDDNLESVFHESCSIDAVFSPLNVFSIEDLLTKGELLWERRGDYKVGDKVRVTKCLHGHGYDIGDIITLVSFTGSDWKTQGNNHIHWYLKEIEFEKIVVQELTVEEISRELGYDVKIVK